MLKGFASLKEKYDARSYFFKLFSLISLIILIIVISSASVLFGRFSADSQKSMQTENTNILAQISYNLQYTSDYANQLLLNLYSRQDSVYLMYNDKPEDFSTYLKIVNIDQSLTDIPFLDTAYIYNGNLDVFYVMGSQRYIREKTSFLDRQAVEWIADPSAIEVGKPQYREITLQPNSLPKRVFSYVLYDAIDQNQTLPRMLVVNVDAEWLLNNIRTMTRNQFGPNSTVYILDMAGRIVTSNAPESDSDDRQGLREQTAADDEVVDCANMLSAAPADGSYPCKREGAPSLLTYQTVPGLGWRLAVLSTNQFIENRISGLRKTTFTIAGVLLLAGLILALLLAKLLHSPIRRLRQSVASLFTEAPTQARSGNEFRHVQQALSAAQEKLVNLQNFKNSNLAPLKQDLLKKMLTKPVKDRQQFTSVLRQLGISLPQDGRYIVVLIKLDHGGKKVRIPFSERERLKSGITEMLVEALSGKCVFEVVEWEEQWVVLMESGNLTGSSGFLPMHSMVEEWEQLQLRMNVFLQGSVSIFISSKGDGLESVSGLYEEAVDLSQYRLTFGAGCLLTEDHVYGKIEDDMPNPAKIVRELREKLIRGEEAAVHAALEEILASFRGHSVQNVKFGIHSLLHHIYLTIITIESNSQLSFDFDLIKENRRLDECETLSDVQSLFHEVLHSMFSKMDERKENKPSHWAEQIMAYIDEHLTDFNLSPNQIAAVLNMSTDYVRKLFKRETGKSISTYINQARVKRIADDLVNSEKTVDSLLEEMGWDNKHYFYKLFKDQYGVTPTEYRIASRIQH